MKCVRAFAIFLVSFIVNFSVCNPQFFNNRAVDNFLFRSDGTNAFIGSFVNSLSQNCHAPSLTSSYVQPQRLRMYHYYEGKYHSYPILGAATQLLKSRMFNPNYITIIYVNGFRCPPTDHIVTGLAKAFERRGGINFLSYDFFAYGDGDYLRYFEVVRTTSPVAKYLSQFMEELSAQGVSKNKIRLIGYSYGAHLAGVAANQYRKATGGLVSRVTALDPINLCFPDTTNVRLGRHSAKFVDTIHTSVMSVSRGSIGHANFIVNGNIERQPGCENDFLRCVHERSAQLYQESITNPQSLLALNCDNWYNFSNGRCRNNVVSPLGFSARSKNRGDFYIRTATRPPYGIGSEGLH